MPDGNFTKHKFHFRKQNLANVCQIVITKTKFLVLQLMTIMNLFVVTKEKIENLLFVVVFIEIALKPRQSLILFQNVLNRLLVLIFI